MEREEQGRRKRERIIKRLYEASLSGSPSSLIELIKEDQLILDRVIVTYFNETPLHVAAMLGHVAFAREILRRKPELAVELDSESSSPLHLASAKGNLEIVKELLRINPSVCCVTDHDGRTPLHLAAIKGRIDVMKELIQTRPEVIHARVDRAASILHLCVKYNRMEALKLLLESASDEELLNSKDGDGNTALHLAAAKKQTKGIELLLDKNGVEVNALNGNGFTALDILAQSPRDIKDMVISESLRAAGALRARDIISSAANNNDSGVAQIRTNGSHTKSSSSSGQMLSPDDKYEWLERKKNSLMIISTVIATMAFQAILSPPGGVWQDNNNHKAGTSILADKDPGLYTAFSVANTICFVGSLSITFLLISGLPMMRRFFMWIMMASMFTIITSLTYSYFISISQLTPDDQLTRLTIIIRVLFGVWFGLVDLVLFLHTARWVFRCVTELPLRPRIFMWIFVLSTIITLSVLSSSLPMSMYGKVNYIIVSIWAGMVIPVLLLYTVRFVKKCWKKLIKQAERLLMMMNIDHNQSNV